MHGEARMEEHILLTGAVALARQAGDEILAVYNRPGAAGVEYKSDNSPLTEADTRAHHVIAAGLAKLTPHIPILSEEAAPESWEQRRQWHCYWLVDPLDGTREFISRNGEFTVNIALIRDGQPVLGVVHAPVQDICYSGLSGAGACRQQGSGEPEAIRGSPLDMVDAAAGLAGTLRVVASRRHGGEALETLLQHLRAKCRRLDLLNMGSSLKICLLAEGKADFYPRLAPTSEWDTAAAHAILCAAGGQIYGTRFETLGYNQKESLLNPSFFAVADRNACWPQMLEDYSETYSATSSKE
jgi:3'(2'), 5'-bisphosphate nucleotidase